MPIKEVDLDNRVKIQRILFLSASLAFLSTAWSYFYVPPSVPSFLATALFIVAELAATKKRAFAWLLVILTAVTLLGVVVTIAYSPTVLRYLYFDLGIFGILTAQCAGIALLLSKAYG